MSENIKVISDRQDIVAIANAVRGKTGITTQMTLGEIATGINNMSVGVDLPELSNPAVASDILSGKEAIDGVGSKITGTFTIEEELTEQNDLISQIATLVATKANPQGGVTLPTLTNPATASDILSGKEAIDKDGNKLTGAIPTQAAKTIIPSTSSQTAVASGVYTTGSVTVAAIPSDYENVGTETSAYTTKIASLESAVTALENELAGKVSGGSGGGIQTCTITISGICGGGQQGVLTRLLDDGLSVLSYIEDGTYDRVVCGSGILIEGVYLSGTASDGNILYCSARFTYQAPTTPGVTATITLVED